MNFNNNMMNTNNSQQRDEHLQQHNEHQQHTSVVCQQARWTLVTTTRRTQQHTSIVYQWARWTPTSTQWTSVTINTKNTKNWQHVNTFNKQQHDEHLQSTTQWTSLVTTYLSYNLTSHMGKMMPLASTLNLNVASRIHRKPKPHLHHKP